MIDLWRPPYRIPWLKTSQALAAEGWPHGWTNGRGPDFYPDPVSDRQSEAMGELTEVVDLTAVAWAKQIHGATVLKAEVPGCIGEADALWTDRPGLGVAGRSADCPLILIACRRDDGTGIWGFAHASWRSTLAGVTTNLLEALATAGASPHRMTAFICPSAGPCCYEVGTEVRMAMAARYNELADSWFGERNGRLILDLWQANSTLMIEAGIPATNIHRADTCTICTSDYPSYRRDGPGASRFAAVIGALDPRA